MLVKDGQCLVGGVGADEGGPAQSLDDRVQMAGGVVGVEVGRQYAVGLRYAQLSGEKTGDAVLAGARGGGGPRIDGGAGEHRGAQTCCFAALAVEAEQVDQQGSRLGLCTWRTWPE